MIYTRDRGQKMFAVNICIPNYNFLMTSVEGSII